MMALQTASGMSCCCWRAALRSELSASPCDVLHDQEQLRLIDHHVEGRHHVGVADARHQPRLLDEHRLELGIGREVRVEVLDGDHPREAGRTGEARQVHRRHPPRRDLLEDGVAADLLERSAELTRFHVHTEASGRGGHGSRRKWRSRRRRRCKVRSRTSRQDHQPPIGGSAPGD